MANIVGKATFDDIPLIDVGDKVQGGLTGASNKQAIALTNRTKFIKEKVEQLTAVDVNADSTGTAESLIAQHKASNDAHPQYLLGSAADERYLQILGANLPNGAVLLDPNGKIPSMYLDFIQSSYVAVANQAARLALGKTANLTIAAQVDVDTLFYLNGGLDPSVLANWVTGQSATVSGVSRVFGRSGNILAQAGDYTTDQVTETLTRVFVSPAEKQGWTAKQEKLVSGTNISTLAGKSLLASGNIVLGPGDVGSAAKIHKHEILDVNNLTEELKLTTSKNLVAGRGISLSANPLDNKVTVDVLSAGAVLSSFIVADRPGVTANQITNFNFQENNSYSFIAYALKEVLGVSNQTTPVETFIPTSEPSYVQSGNLIFNNGARPYTGEIVSMVKEGVLYYAPLNLNGDSFKIDTLSKSDLPLFVSSNTENGQTAAASSIYSTGYDVYLAFNGKTDYPNYWCSQSGTGSPTEAAPQWIMVTPATTWAGVPKGYSITSLRGDGSAPSSWKVQGGNADGSWDDLDVQTNYTPSRVTAMNFTFNATKSYKSYRLYITKSDATDSWMRVDEFTMAFNADSNLFLRDKNSVYYTLDPAGKLKVIALADVKTNAGFSNLPNTLNSAVADLLPLELISTNSVGGTLIVTPGNSFLKTKAPFNVGNYVKINTMIFKATLQTGGEFYLALTRNGMDYFGWDGNAWVGIALTGNVTTDTNTLLTKGTKVSVINALTPAQIALLYNDKVDGLGYAGVLVNGTTGAASVINFLNIVGDLRSTWKLQTPAEVEINRGVGVLSFKPIAAGNYKFAYQFL